MPTSKRGSASSGIPSVRFLKAGDVVSFPDGTEVTVADDKLLGHGGQGNIYKALDEDGHEYALKWIVNEKFFRKNNSYFYNNLLLLSKSDNSEGKLSNFAFPLKLSNVESNGQFGYLMDIIPKHMVKLDDVVSGRRVFELFDIELKACKTIAESFSNLHFYNFIFSDINSGSIFFDLDSGDVKICDCDNIVPVDDQVQPIGTMGYMAPEVFKNKKCTKRSDYFSLAIIFYRILLRDDPFEGKKYKGIFTEELKQEMYIEHPIFTMSPDDDSNRPLNDGTIKGWESLPPDIKTYFEDTFTDGISTVKMRKDAHSWSGIFSMWINDIRSNAFYRLDLPKPEPKTQIVMFIVDVSGSMAGKKIDEVNNAIRECTDELKRCEGTNSLVHFEISILLFGDSCRWYKGKYVQSIDDFQFDDIVPKDGMTGFDDVCMTLDMVLKGNELVDPERKYKRPCLLLISDGGCHYDYYEPYLTELRTNKIFINSQKYALGANDEKHKAKVQMLSDFTGDLDNVQSVDVIKEKLGELIYNLTLTFSMSETADPDKLKMKTMVTNMGQFAKYSSR